MRLSIWQQFSSNHSASFTVVGVFESAEAAQKAAAEINRLLIALADYYVEHRNILEAYWEDAKDIPISPVEIAFAKEYEIPIEDWTYIGTGIDWVSERSDADKAVHVLGDMVSVENALNTWVGHPPFDELLKRMGGSVFLQTEFGGQILLNVKCTAPDQATAMQVEEILNQVLANAAELTESDLDDLPYLYEGIVTRDGQVLALAQVQLESPFHESLPRLLSALRRFGCNHVSYSLEQRE